MPRLRPGCLLRSSLALFGVLFLPFAAWFLWRDARRNWFTALALLVFSVLALVLALDKRENGWLSRFDDL